MTVRELNVATEGIRDRMDAIYPPSVNWGSISPANKVIYGAWRKMLEYIEARICEEEL